MTAKLLLCLALASFASGTAAAHPCPPAPTKAKAIKAKPVDAPTEAQVTALYQKAADRIRVAAMIDADTASKLSTRYRTIKATNAIETAQGRIRAAAALEKLAADAESVLP